MPTKKGYNCSVVGCKKPHFSLHRLPASHQHIDAWINFIFNGNVPKILGKIYYVCAHHFIPEDFSNLGQFHSGHASRLCLYPGAVPTVRNPGTDDGNASASGQVQATVHHVACQTDPPKQVTVATQLSLKTLQPHFRSKGTQTTMSCTDIGVGTSTAAFTSEQPLFSSTSIKRPCKRPRLEMEDKDEGSTI